MISIQQVAQSRSVVNSTSRTRLTASQGEYISTTHVLVSHPCFSTVAERKAHDNCLKVKTEYDPRNPTLSLVASYDGEYDDVGFTISVYACRPLSWGEGPTKLPFHEVVSFSSVRVRSERTERSVVCRSVHLQVRWWSSSPANIHAEPAVPPANIL